MAVDEVRFYFVDQLLAGIQARWKIAEHGNQACSCLGVSSEHIHAMHLDAAYHFESRQRSRSRCKHSHIVARCQLLSNMLMR